MATAQLMLHSIAKCIENRTTSFLIGIASARIAGKVPLCVGHRPQEQPDRCVLVGESGGGVTIPDLKDRIDKNVQIITRSKTYFTARDDAWEIFEAMHDACCPASVWAYQQSGEEYQAPVILANSDPQYIGQDERRRFEFSTNFVWKIMNPV